MTTQQPPRCHYDRTLGERVTRAHLDTCPDPDDCDGCEPCLVGHCGTCGREHLDDVHPNTCPDCVGGVREDLGEVQALCGQLRGQAAHGSNDGRPWAAAPIPGAAAMVLVGPSTAPELVRVSRHTLEDHRRSDPVPPLAVLAHWEDRWRSWLGQDHRRRAGIRPACDYLTDQLTLIAQARPRIAGGDVRIPPEFPEFSKAIARLRAHLEATLHDEQQPDRGVECFECGGRLVRRHRDRKHCRHATPARVALGQHLRGREQAQAWLAVLASYRLRPTSEETRAAMLPSRELVQAARLPCDRCDQGGIADPRPGISWECPSCRMSYSPGEYATAVRRDLLDSDDGDGWTDIGLAADAATTLVGYEIPANTVRRWMDRNQVASLCQWSYVELPDGSLQSRPWGLRLVYWPDVAEAAAASQMRAIAAAEARRRRAERAATEATEKTAAEREAEDDGTEEPHTAA